MGKVYTNFSNIQSKFKLDSFYHILSMRNPNTSDTYSIQWYFMRRSHRFNAWICLMSWSVLPLSSHRPQERASPWPIETHRDEHPSKMGLIKTWRGHRREITGRIYIYISSSEGGVVVTRLWRCDPSKPLNPYVLSFWMKSDRKVKCWVSLWYFPLLLSIHGDGVVRSLL